MTHFFSVGRHEQMIPMLTSRLLQSAAMGLSQLMSSETETAYSDCRRSSEMMQVTPPRQNTKVKASFCARGRFNVLMTGRGRTATEMSVMMFSAALVNLMKSQYWVIVWNGIALTIQPADSSRSLLPLGRRFAPRSS
jgi:hypothetical protein